MTNYICTATSNIFDYTAIDKNTISILDIAIALSKMCRFAGHSTYMYPIAAHCLLVQKILKEQCQPASTQLVGLLHDSAETYMSDITSALKRTMSTEYKNMEIQVENRIFESLVPNYNLEEIKQLMKIDIKKADILAFFVEMRWCLTIPANMEHELIKSYSNYVTYEEILAARKKYSNIVESYIKQINFNKTELRETLHQLECEFIDTYVSLAVQC